MPKNKKDNDFQTWLYEICTGKRFKAWRKEIWEHKYLILLSLLLVTIAVSLDYISGTYVTKVGIAEAPDLVLDHIKPINLKFIFTYGYVFLVVLFFFYPLFFKVKKLSNSISQFSLLLVTRSFFISLTHLKTPDTAIPIDFPWVFNKIVFENDLFFSGHTAIIFLGFLLYKDSKIRWIFLVGSILMGATSLLMHRHYTIDVLAAFFITYGMFKIGEKIFKRL